MRVQKQCVYIDQLELQLTLTTARPALDWVGQRNDFKEFSRSVSTNPKAYKLAVAVLKKGLAKRGLFEVTEIGVYDKNWTWKIDLKEEQQPSILVSFTLNISKLSRDDVKSVQKVLARSTLEHLRNAPTLMNGSDFGQLLLILACCVLKSEDQGLRHKYSLTQVF
ncbi:hypothetical protein BGZ82_006571 [Podila clonocystis]|nr:hypothetical protein BGZ82_006571 [Podila clonocystis]